MFDDGLFDCVGRSVVDSSVDASVVQFGLGDYTAVDGLLHWLVDELFDWSVVVRFDYTASVDGSFAALVDGCSIVFYSSVDASAWVRRPMAWSMRVTCCSMRCRSVDRAVDWLLDQCLG